MRTIGSIGEETAKSIRRCAVDLIAEHGFEAMSLRQLAERVGITTGALYNHIGGKQELLFGLLHAVMQDLLAAVDSQVLSHLDPLTQYQAFVQLHIQFHTDRKNDVLIATTELRSLNSENYKKIIKLRNRYEATLSRILKHGCRTGIFSVTDTKLAVLALIPMLTGVSQWYRPGGRLSRNELIERYLELSLVIAGASRKKSSLLVELPDIDLEANARTADFGAKRRRFARSRDLR